MAANTFCGLIACAILLTQFCFADGEKSETPMRAIISQSRRFVVWAPERETGAFWSVWAEDSTGQLVDLLGIDPPFFDTVPIYIHLISRANPDPGPVSTLQAYPDSSLKQRLIINVSGCSQTEALAGLSRLICNRYAIARQNTAGKNIQLARMPDWFTTGIALNLPGSNRGHLRSLAAAIWKNGDMASLEDCLRLESIEDRITPSQEATLYALMRWLLSLEEFGPMFRQVAAASAEHRSVERRDLLDHIEGASSLRELEREWELALAEISRIEAFTVYNSPIETIARLESIVEGVTEQYWLLAGVELELDDLADFRAESWMPDLCARAFADLQDLAVTPEQDVRETIHLYLDIFGKLSKPKGNFIERLLGETASDGKIESMIAKAEKKKQRLRQLYERYNSYLDKVEQKLYNQTDVWRYTPSAEEIEYIDNFEAKYDL